MSEAGNFDEVMFAVEGFGEKLRVLADERFAQLYNEQPELARFAAVRADTIAILCLRTVDEPDDHPALSTLRRAAQKTVFLFADPGQEDGGLPDHTVVMTLLKDFPLHASDTQATANAADVSANFLMTMYRSEATERAGAAWAGMSPSEQLWYTVGFAEGRQPHDFE